MWMLTVNLLLIGYFCMGRSFAYWGVPAWNLFVGELVLAAFVLHGPLSKVGRWPWIAVRSPSLTWLVRAYLLFFIFGALEVLHGVASGFPILAAARDFAFNYYPIYFFLGLWVGVKDDAFLRRFFRIAAWVNGIYGILFVLFLSNLSWVFPGVSKDVIAVPIFGQPSYSAAILLGLLSFEKDLRRVWYLLILNAAVLIGMLIRAEWLAFGIGLLVWAWATRNLKRVVLGGVTILFLFTVMYVTGFSYEGPQTRGGTISAMDLMGRVIAPFDSDLAKGYTSDVQMYEGTTVWRTVWWLAIWSDVNSNAARALFGHGYGYPLNELVPYLLDSATRTPHSIFFYTLGYTGWLGVAIFGVLQLTIAKFLWATYRATGQPFGISFWFAIFAFASFTPFFETPQGAIPYYLIVGCACAPGWRINLSSVPSKPRRPLSEGRNKALAPAAEPIPAFVANAVEP